MHKLSKYTRLNKHRKLVAVMLNMSLSFSYKINTFEKFRNIYGHYRKLWRILLLSAYSSVIIIFLQLQSIFLLHEMYQQPTLKWFQCSLIDTLPASSSASRQALFFFKYASSSPFKNIARKVYHPEKCVYKVSLLSEDAAVNYLL